jgi:hypothetical protein
MPVTLASVVYSAACCPLLGMLFCVGWSIAFDFADTTWTHCVVPNILPSIRCPLLLHLSGSVVCNGRFAPSAAIGDKRPQRYAWMMATALSIIQRTGVGFVYHASFAPHVARGPVLWRVVNVVALAAHTLENVGVFLLSFVTSKDNFAVHALGFSLFGVCAAVNVVCRLALSARQPTCPTLRAKTGLVAINLGSVLAAGYFYWRHNAYCEPYVYSCFALCEYVVVLSNIAFHALLPKVWSSPVGVFLAAQFIDDMCLLGFAGSASPFIHVAEHVKAAQFLEPGHENQ